MLIVVSLPQDIACRRQRGKKKNVRRKTIATNRRDSRRDSCCKRLLSRRVAAIDIVRLIPAARLHTACLRQCGDTGN